jgi:hypothetical protein
LFNLWSRLEQVGKDNSPLPNACALSVHQTEENNRQYNPKELSLSKGFFK